MYLYVIDYLIFTITGITFEEILFNLFFINYSDNTMWKNFIITTLRNISRNRVYAFINVFGLSIGLASSILILLFVNSELSYDKHHEQGDRIYRLYISGMLEGNELNGGWSAIPSGPAFQQEIPEVKDFTRFKTWGQNVLIREDEKFIQETFVFADSSVFRIFDFNLIRGDPDKALTEPNTIVLTESLARKIFKDEDPVGKVLGLNQDTTIYRVTGVMEDLPPTTHFRFNSLASYHSLDESDRTHWLSNNVFTYLLLENQSSASVVQEKMDQVSLKYIEPELKAILGIDISQFEAAGNRYGIKIQPMKEIHLNNEIGGGFKSSHDSKYLLIFSFVAVLILIIASINFMNLSTARSAIRAKEVGIRKVIGSTKYLLVRQFLWESMLLTIASLLLALLMVELLLPKFNEMIDLNLSIDYFSEWYIVPSLLLLAVLIGLISGSYPSFILSAFRPAEVLKGEFSSGKKGGLLRNILVVVQFSISIIIISGTLIVYKQLSFMTNRDLGFNKDQVVVMNRLWPLDDKVRTFLEEVEKVPGVAKASNSTQYPGEINNNNGYQIKGRDRSKTYLLITNWTDEDFAETYEVPMVEGRFFSREFASDSSACVINETTVRNFGIEDPLNTIFLRPSDDGNPEELRVIGVIKDYHLTSLRTSIEPALYQLKPHDWGGGYGNIKLSGSSTGYHSTLQKIENLWNEFVPGEPFLYFFLDEHFRSLYNEEIRTGRISMVFSILAILIATLGLFGLTLFNTEKRTKEIGIRKVMGAGNGNITLLILKDIALLLLIATAIGWTVSWFVMDNWLQDFPYRANMGITVFLLSAGIAFLIAVLTVGIQARNAARKNPAESLQYE